MSIQSSTPTHRAVSPQAPRLEGQPNASAPWSGFNRPLILTTLFSLGLIILALAGLMVDPRVITGAPAWLKPLKFAISFVAYCFTLAWLLSFVRGHPRLVMLIGATTTLGAIAELVVITLQVIRGTTSHFNVGTPFDATLWTIMGISIIPIWLGNLGVALLLIFQKLPDSAFAWSLRLGVLISFVGMGLGFLMTAQRTPAQREAYRADESPLTEGAHSVGAPGTAVEDGGPGLPVVGWSTQGGDLRAPHFFGLHGLQVLPLVGYLVTHFGAGTLSMDRRRALVWTAGLGYLGFVLLLTWQALRGQPVIDPDALTLAAFGALVGGVAVSSWVICASARPLLSAQNRQ